MEISPVDERHKRLVDVVADHACLHMCSFQFAFSQSSLKCIVFWMRLLWFIDSIQPSPPEVEGVAPCSSLPAFLVGYLRGERDS